MKFISTLNKGKEMNLEIKAIHSHKLTQLIVVNGHNYLKALKPSKSDHLEVYNYED